MDNKVIAILQEIIQDLTQITSSCLIVEDMETIDNLKRKYIDKVDAAKKEQWKNLNMTDLLSKWLAAKDSRSFIEFYEHFKRK